MPDRPGMPLMSTTCAGLMSRSFISGMRLWPPERTLASSPSRARRAVASPTVVGAWYWKAAGIIVVVSRKQNARPAAEDPFLRDGPESLVRRSSAADCLVEIPVRYYPAVERQDLVDRQVEPGDVVGQAHPGRIHERRGRRVGSRRRVDVGLDQQLLLG